MSFDLEIVARILVRVLIGHSVQVHTLVGQVALETLVGLVKHVETLMIWVDLEIPVVIISFGALVRLIKLVDTLMGWISFDTMKDSAISDTLVG